MSNNRISALLAVALAVAAALPARGQSLRELMRRGEALYDAQRYPEALEAFAAADSLSRKETTAAYWAARALLQIDGRELQAIPYLERVAAARNTPPDTYKELGILYHQSFLFDKAIRQFSEFLRLAAPDDPDYAYCERMISTSANAKRVAEARTARDATPLGRAVNAGYAEYAPYISADMQVMVFTRIDKAPGEGGRRVKRFMKATSGDGVTWGAPQELRLPAGVDAGRAELAGIAQDGFTVYLSLGGDNDADLYSAQIRGAELVNPQRLPDAINSRFGEHAIAFSSDGSTCIFSSSRPGGIGGIDLYISTKDANGEWTPARNLGQTINTEADENHPFWHPSGQRLVFASQGHSTIGGYDLFESTLGENNFWSRPENMTAINSVYDDRHYSTDAQGSRALFAQSVNYHPDVTKLYTQELRENIPMTMLKGSIKVGYPPKPHPARIKVYDHNTREQVKYVYSPDKYTGQYLMIFPPGRDYDIIIYADGFMPQTINVFVPNQKSFYELFQEIILEPIELGNKRIGENLKVRNSFYNLYTYPDAAPGADTKDYSQLLDLIEGIINQTDSLGQQALEAMTVSESPLASPERDYGGLLDMIGQAIEATDSVQLQLLDQNTLYDEVTVAPTYYRGGDPGQSMQAQVYGADTLLTAPAVKVDDNRTVIPRVSDRMQATSRLRNSKPSDREYVAEATILFDLNDIQPRPHYYADVADVARTLLGNAALGVELHGWADPQGDERYNYNLSERRAAAVARHLAGQGVEAGRILLVPHGIDTASAPAAAQGDPNSHKRRVEARIFKLTSHD